MFFLILSVLPCLYCWSHTTPAPSMNPTVSRFNCLIVVTAAASISPPGRSGLDEGAEFEFQSSYHPGMGEAEDRELIWKTDRDRKSTRLNSSHLGISYA